MLVADSTELCLDGGELAYICDAGWEHNVGVMAAAAVTIKGFDRTLLTLLLIVLSSGVISLGKYSEGLCSFALLCIETKTNVQHYAT